LVFLAGLSLNAAAQGGADGRPVFENLDDCNSRTKNIRETCMKMRIERSKKDHNEMLERGEEVRRLSERLEKSFAQNGRLSETDRALLDNLEKSVKKIRSELGGNDDDEKTKQLMNETEKTSVADAVERLSKAAVDLADELQKTTRFSISAAAIQSSNAVLTVARFLRIKD
jgi:hypothetical protein